MFQDKIDITLNCNEDIFQSNFGLFIKNRTGGRCNSQVKKKLSGSLNDNMISIWYNPKCFRQPFTLPIARGTFRQVETSKTRVELDIFIEGHYPLTYLAMGVITYAVVLFIFAFENPLTFNFWTIETALLIGAPIVILLMTMISFRNSVRDTKQELTKYLRIISKKRK